MHNLNLSCESDFFTPLRVVLPLNEFFIPRRPLRFARKEMYKSQPQAPHNIIYSYHKFRFGLSVLDAFV